MVVIIIISLKVFLSFFFCFAFGSIGLQRAAAQLVPPPAPFVSSPVAAPSATGPINPTVTKIVRIINGVGYFDDALAEKLRPRLAKAFPFSMTEPLKALAGAPVPSSAKPEGPKKVAATHL
jgi:hypothetical protein